MLILGAVISGIIIDTFGAKRDEKTEMDADIRDIDFVSGLERRECEAGSIASHRRAITDVWRARISLLSVTFSLSPP